MATLAIEIIDQFAPNACPNYRAAFDEGSELLSQFNVTTPRRIAHFMAQAMHETGALTKLVESGVYHDGSLGSMWDAGNWHRCFSDRNACTGMAKQCAIDKGEALLSLVYGNRMGNGPPETHDGWTFRGRGLLQTTGRAAYRKYSARWNVDFEGNPELIVAPEHALKPALSEWDAGHLNAAADANDIAVITRWINGGYNGLSERKAWFARIWSFAKDRKPVEETIEWKVQEALRKAGYDYVVCDGVVGPKTRTAILDFRAKHGLEPGTGIDAGLIAALQPELTGIGAHGGAET
jgi:putative chitinase